MNDNKTKLAFNTTNYILMITGIVILSIGFFIMTQDQSTYGFGFMGITLGPIIVVIGFILFRGGKKK